MCSGQALENQTAYRAMFLGHIFTDIRVGTRGNLVDITQQAMKKKMRTCVSMEPGAPTVKIQRKIPRDVTAPSLAKTRTHLLTEREMSSSGQSDAGKYRRVSKSAEVAVYRCAGWWRG